MKMRDNPKPGTGARPTPAVKLPTTAVNSNRRTANYSQPNSTSGKSSQPNTTPANASQPTRTPENPSLPSSSRNFSQATTSHARNVAHATTSGANVARAPSTLPAGGSTPGNRVSGAAANTLVSGVVAPAPPREVLLEDDGMVTLGGFMDLFKGDAKARAIAKIKEQGEEHNVMNNRCTGWRVML